MSHCVPRVKPPARRVCSEGAQVGGNGLPHDGIAHDAAVQVGLRLS